MKIINVRFLRNITFLTLTILMLDTPKAFCMGEDPWDEVNEGILDEDGEFERTFL